MIPTILLFLFAAQQGVRTLPADGWMQSVSGKEPPVSVQIDRQALVVSAENPTNFALSQEIFLSPGTLWRAIARIAATA